VELGGERNRVMYVLKSRGMAHSNQLREFLITEHGLELTEAYLGPEGVLTGSLRFAQEARERAAKVARTKEAQAKERERLRKREALEARIAAMRKDFEVEDAEAGLVVTDATLAEQALHSDRQSMARLRKGSGPNLSSRRERG
jgi:circadian clock protein KaiC